MHRFEITGRYLRCIIARGEQVYTYSTNPIKAIIERLSRAVSDIMTFTTVVYLYQPTTGYSFISVRPVERIITPYIMLNGETWA